MSEIKIPVSWLKEKGIELAVGDIYYHSILDDEYTVADCELKGLSHSIRLLYITSFADRENTGKQPVADWVPVIVNCESGTVRSAVAGNYTYWWTDGSIESYKPNIEELYKIYLAERGFITEENFTDEEKMQVAQRERNVEIANMVDEGKVSHYESIFKTKEDLIKRHENASKSLSKICSFIAGNNLMLEDESPDECVIRELSEKHDIDTRTDEEKEYISIGSIDAALRAAKIKLTKEINEYLEDNKLKLTKDDIGKEFVTEEGMVFDIVLVGGLNAVIKHGCIGFNTCLLTGEIDESEHKLIKRHEPRWWIKDLPDASVFKDGWLYCVCGGNWMLTTQEPYLSAQGWRSCRLVEGRLGALCMPHLKSEEEVKLSKISIDELRELQKELKDG